jgi:hypothetical protein
LHRPHTRLSILSPGAWSASTTCTRPQDAASARDLVVAYPQTRPCHRLSLVSGAWTSPCLPTLILYFYHRPPSRPLLLPPRRSPSSAQLDTPPPISLTPTGFCLPKHAQQQPRSSQVVLSSTFTFPTACVIASATDQRPRPQIVLCRRRVTTRHPHFIADPNLGSCEKKARVRGGQDIPLRTYQHLHLLVRSPQRSHRGF